MLLNKAFADDERVLLLIERGLFADPDLNFVKSLEDVDVVCIEHGLLERSISNLSEVHLGALRLDLPELVLELGFITKSRLIVFSRVDLIRLSAKVLPEHVVNLLLFLGVHDLRLAVTLVAAHALDVLIRLTLLCNIAILALPVEKLVGGLKNEDITLIDAVSSALNFEDASSGLAHTS